MAQRLKSGDLSIQSDSNVYVNSKYVNGNPGILLVHASWCGHCVKFMPVYTEIAQNFKQKGDRFNVVAIESEELKDKNINLKLNITGFPTILFFDQKGRVMNAYKGSRNKDMIMNEICNVYHHCISKH